MAFNGDKNNRFIPEIFSIFVSYSAFRPVCDHFEYLTIRVLGSTEHYGDPITFKMSVVALQFCTRKFYMIKLFGQVRLGL